MTSSILVSLALLIALAPSTMAVVRGEDEDLPVGKFQRYFATDVFQDFLPFKISAATHAQPLHLFEEECNERTRVYSYLACDGVCERLGELQYRMCRAGTVFRPDHEAVQKMCCPQMAELSLKLASQTPEEAERERLDWMKSVADSFPNWAPPKRNGGWIQNVVNKVIN